MADHFARIERESKPFLTQYGDFTTFFHRPDFGQFLQGQVLAFWKPADFDRFFDKDHWIDKHPFNFPGPLYTGASDSCGTGVEEAPHNVMLDASCQEFVFRQPTAYAELLMVLYAGRVETMDSYSANGNDHWTIQECRTWWRNREYLVRSLANEELVKLNNGQAQLYLDYLNGAAERDLRRYGYFLDNGVYPTIPSTILPEL